MVGVWEGLNLGSIPNDHMPSQKDPKISIERRCSTILPNGKHKSASESDIQEVLSKQGQSVLHITYLTWDSLGQFLSPTID